MSTPSSGQARVNAKRAQRAEQWAHHTGAPQTPQVIWTIHRAVHGSDYQATVIEWLAANGIDAATVDACSSITVCSGEIRYRRILRNDNGRPYEVLPGVPATATEVAPLLVPFESPVTT